MTIQERIEDIKSLIKDQCWYVVRQKLDFPTLCYATLILENYKSENPDSNLETYFASESSKYGISGVHRMLLGASYVGLTLKTDSRFENDILSDVYFAIKKRCNSDFSKVNLYNDIIVNQIEKIYLSHYLDNEKDGLRSDFKIHPVFFIYKVITVIGSLTNDYSISFDEFKKFIGTAKKYEDFLTSTSLILESRNNADLNTDLDYLTDYHTEIQDIDKTLFAGNRFNVLLENLNCFEIDKSNIKLKKEYIEETKRKVNDYELKNIDDFFSEIFFTSTKNISSSTPQVDTNQKIYFGAPGTGKSYKVEKLTSELPEEQVERIIFHPEYDYASFIGGYKPTMVLIEDKEEIQYKFVPQAFTNVYVKAHNNPAKDYYLIIEEINRGNCAEIFGDIFQLLDRNNDYKISPSKELKEYLEEKLTDTGIVNGKMILPSNLHILATMNTSDQSLFPMDSAFKRRWDWEYIPINYEPFYEEENTKEENKSFNYFVEFTDKSTFKWIEFIEKVNNKIKSNDGLGMDKCIGNYFVKSIDDKITFSQFLNKAIFYLWNDVFKDETENDSIFKNKTTYEDFFPLKQGELLMMKILKDLEVEITENNISNSEE